jgi:S-adenosylmethionine decarboxylase
METKGGKKSKKSSIQYESPLGYGIEDVRPHGGSEKFRTAAYSNVRVFNNLYLHVFSVFVVLSTNLDPRLLLLKVPFSAINIKYLLAFHHAFSNRCADI